MLTKEEVRLISEHLKLQQFRERLDLECKENQRSLKSRFPSSRLKTSIRIVLDDKVVTIAQDATAIRVHTSPLEGVFTTSPEPVDGEKGRGFPGKDQSFGE